MFEELGPENPPQPPAGALEQAVQRGRSIRRRRRAGVASGLALSIALIGGIALANPFQDNRSLVVPADPTTPPPDYSPIPERPGETAAGHAGLDFGTLTDITTGPGGALILHVDRSTFYFGEEAMAQSGDPTREVFVKDTDGEGKELTFALDPKASLQAEGPLRDDHEGMERVTITPEQLVANLKDIEQRNAEQPDPDAQINVFVWMRHVNGTDGPVTALVDQFMP